MHNNLKPIIINYLTVKKLQNIEKSTISFRGLNLFVQLELY